MRPSIALAIVALSVGAFAPSSALAGGVDGEYLPPDLGPGNHGNGPRGDFDLSDEFDQTAPSTENAPTTGAAPVAPTTTTAPVDPEAAARAERKARRKARRKRELKLAEKRVAKAAVATAAASDDPPVSSGRSDRGTETATDISRTAFEGDGAGPLPMIVGVLLLLTGVGLVVRGRRPTRDRV